MVGWGKDIIKRGFMLVVGVLMDSVGYVEGIWIVGYFKYVRKGWGKHGCMLNRIKLKERVCGHG